METNLSRGVWLGVCFAAVCTAACAPPLSNPLRTKVSANSSKGAASTVAGTAKPVAAAEGVPKATEPASAPAQAAPVPAKPKGIEGFVLPKGQAAPAQTAPEPEIRAVPSKVPTEDTPVATDSELERFVGKRVNAAGAERSKSGSVLASVQPTQVEEPEEPRDGKYLYARNCAGCHGLTGKGDGETAKQLKVVARDFAAGGFAFGNTREALFRTISSGLPGRSVMPAYAGSLTEEERWLVVDYVRTLMPLTENESGDSAQLVVRGHCAMARGKLPPVVEDGPEVVRGLLLGFPGGLSMEYALDDVRPIAARLGAFAKREDWDGRGGSYLRPLGTLVHHYEAGGASAAFHVSQDGQQFKAGARIQDTWARGEEAGLAYELLDPQHKTIAQVREDLSAIALSTGTAIERRLTIQATSASSIVTVLAAKLPAGDHHVGSRSQPKSAGALGDIGTEAQEGPNSLTAWWARVAPDQYALLVIEGALSCGLDPSGTASVRVACSNASAAKLRLVFAPAAASDEAGLERVLAEFGL